MALLLLLLLLWGVVLVGAVPEVRVSWDRSADAISFTQGFDPPHDPSACIHPAPFGTQCTVHLKDALAACWSMPQCSALVCPTQRPYRDGVPKKHIHGAICQIRRHVDMDEHRHGMCMPDGCTRWTVERLAESADAEGVTRHTKLRVVLEKSLVAYECRGVPDSSVCAGSCIDMSQAGLRFAGAHRSAGSGDLVCVFE
jgi:hypothetical protein